MRDAQLVDTCMLIVLEMSYESRRILRACKSKYRYTELFELYRAGLQAEEQMLN